MAIIYGSNKLNDRLIGTGGFDQIYGYGGNDVIEGGAGADQIFGGEGIDTASYKNSRAAVVVNLNPGIMQLGGDAQGDRLDSIENVIGSAHDDTITGNGAANRLEGGAGTDMLNGGGGDDWLFGGFDGRADIINGGTGNDTVDYSSAPRGMTITLAGSSDGSAVLDAMTSVTYTPIGPVTVHQEAVTEDVLRGVENVIGTAVDDHIFGNSSNNRLEGGAGDDVIEGGGGVDTILSGLGKDDLTGGAGADRFVFNAYQDSGKTWTPLSGGGANVIDHGIDTIHDYEAGVDRIDLSGIDANVNQSDNQAFHWVDQFTGQAGELVLIDPSLLGGQGNSGSTNEDGVRIMGDVNGDASPDFVLMVQWAPSLDLFSQSDVVL
jgi:Ca2+-binding RTX toxin-like protein